VPQTGLGPTKAIEVVSDVAQIPEQDTPSEEKESGEGTRG